MINYDGLCQKFSAHFNFLNYLTVKCKINVLLTKFGLYWRGHLFVLILSIFLKAKKEQFTKFLYHFQNDHKMKSRWNEDLEIYIDPDTWRILFSVCFRIVTNNNLIWFQLKLI